MNKFEDHNSALVVDNQRVWTIDASTMVTVPEADDNDRQYDVTEVVYHAALQRIHNAASKPDAPLILPPGTYIVKALIVVTSAQKEETESASDELR